MAQTTVTTPCITEEEIGVYILTFTEAEHTHHLIFFDWYAAEASLEHYIQAGEIAQVNSEQ